jgi:hypothetical protein
VSTVATGTKVLLFALLEFSSFEDCNKAKEILAPLGHHNLIYECQWHNHSDVFYFTHASKHEFYSRMPLRRPDRLYYYPTNAK